MESVLAEDVDLLAGAPQALRNALADSGGDVRGLERRWEEGI